MFAYDRNHVAVWVCGRMYVRTYACLYGLYLPTVILTVIWYSITHSLFISRLKTFLIYKSFPL